MQSFSQPSDSSKRDFKGVWHTHNEARRVKVLELSPKMQEQLAKQPIAFRDGLAVVRLELPSEKRTNRRVSPAEVAGSIQGGAKKAA